MSSDAADAMDASLVPLIEMLFDGPPLSELFVAPADTRGSTSTATA
jgi:hypothetical protein